MKHNNNPDHVRSVGQKLVHVRFEFTHPTATTVSLAGTFNQWQPEPKTRLPGKGGRWMRKMILAPGTYEYCIVVDGQWTPDPLAVEDVPNPFGGRNSILKVAHPLKASSLSVEKKLTPKKPNILHPKHKVQLCK